MQHSFNIPPIGMPTKGAIEMYSGDRLEVHYMDPDGRMQTLLIDVANPNLMVVHQQSQAAIVIRPSKVDISPPFI